MVACSNRVFTSPPGPLLVPGWVLPSGQAWEGHEAVGDVRVGRLNQLVLQADTRQKDTGMEVVEG
jgi:hypothetical protein